jgi:tryptophan synthase alpha chain
MNNFYQGVILSRLSEHLVSINNKNEKALSVFLTAGFPDKNNFTDLAAAVLNNGADLIELGVPFSDPLADGPVIQQSSHTALNNGINTKMVLTFTEKIKSKINKPIILMGYANPILNYGTEKFLKDANNAGADGLIVPDIPVEEFDLFFQNKQNGLDVILLTTPTSSEHRIKTIDEHSSGFVYCVSVTGTTGMRKNFSEETLCSLKRTYSLIKKNKMLIGFGVSSKENIIEISPYCDGVIVGSAVINKLMNDNSQNFNETLKFINELKSACLN